MKRLLVRVERPVWPVMLVSALVAVLALAALLVAYGRTAQWRYGALAALAGLVVLVHALAWWIAHTRGRASLAVRLVAAAQVVAAIVTPLLLADFWLVGLPLLLAVPIEIGAAEQPRRMPLFTIFALVAAAAMVAVDLISLPDRLTILSDRPLAFPLAATCALLQAVTLAFLLWYRRLRPGSPSRVPLDLATQLSLMFIALAAVSILLVTGVLIAQIRASQIGQVGRSFEVLARTSAERTGNVLEQQILALASLPRRETVLLDGLAAANTYTGSAEEIRQLLQERERMWEAAPDDSAFVLQYRNNAQSLALSRFRGGDLLHNDMLLTDRFGGLVAAQGERPSRFAYGDTAWWQTAWSGGAGDTYLGDLAIDPRTKIASVFMAVAVLDPQTNRTVGVLASRYQLRAIQVEIAAATTEAGAVRLLTSDGVLIAGPETAGIGESDPLGKLASSDDGPARTAPGWLLGDDERGAPVVLASAPLSTSSQVNLAPLRALGWRVVVADSQAQALAGVTRSTEVAGLVGLLTLVLVVVAATAISRLITRPIEQLTTTAASISEGDLEQRARPTGPVELVTLAESFNILTDRLRSLISGLQQQVALRTAQLEARVEQLATLNRITETVASGGELQAALGSVARDIGAMFGAGNVSFALLTSSRTELRVVAESSTTGRGTDAARPVFNLASNAMFQQVVQDGRAIISSRSQTGGPLQEGTAQLLGAPGLEHLMIVPLLAHGEVIGIIGIGTDRVTRAFSETEVALAETVAGQIAGAIENARLFEEREAQRRDLEQLYRLGTAMQEVLSLDERLQIILQGVQQVVGFERGVIWLPTTDDRYLETRSWVGFDHEAQPVRLPIDGGAPALSRAYRDLAEVILDGAAPVPDEYRVAEPYRRVALLHSRAPVVLPLLSRGRCVGVLAVDNGQTRRTARPNLDVLRPLAANAAGAIENARLYAALQEELGERRRAEEALRKQNEYLAALQETALGLLGRLELTEVLETIVTRAGTLMGTSNGSVWLLELGETEMQLRVSVGAYREPVGALLKPGEGLAGRVWQTGEPLVLEDYQAWSSHLAQPAFRSLHAVVGVPLKSGAQVVG